MIGQNLWRCQMVSVTTRTRTVKQPYGGYLPVKQMNKIQYEDNIKLHSTNDEFVSPSIIGLAVDYLTRLMMGHNKKEVFAVSLRGARLINESDTAFDLLENIVCLDEKSIVSTCKLVGFDSVYRAGPMAYKPIQTIKPSNESIEDIKTMVTRSMDFFDNNGPIRLSGFTFEGGYSTTIDTGDADFLTSQGLWDLKVLKNSISSKHTLQILVYYIMGLRSKHQNLFKEVDCIGIFNPKLTIAYVKNIKDLDKKLIEIVSKEVIGL